MFVKLRDFTPKRRSNRVFISRRAAVTASLSAIATLSACGGGQKTGNPLATNGGAFTISAQLPAATAGSSYSGTVTASGVTSPYKFVVSSGQMPQGVNLDQTTGNVTGTPTAPGNYKFGITATDAKGALA